MKIEEIIKEYNSKGVEYIIEGKYEEASEWLEKLVETYENASEEEKEKGREVIKRVYNNLGVIYYTLKKYEEAGRYYKKIIELDGENYELYVDLGEIYSNLERYEEAEKYYKKAEEINPTSKDVYNNLGVLYYNWKKYEEAEKYYRKVLDLDSSNKWVYNNLGILYCELNRYEEAEKCYKEMLKLEIYNNVVYIHLGILYNSMGEYDKAIESYKKAIELDRNNVCSNVGFLRFIEKYLTQKQVEILNLIFDNRLYLSVNILNILNKVDISDLGNEEKNKLIEKIEKIKLSKKDFGKDDFDMKATNILYMYRNINEYTIKSLVFKGIYKSNSELFNDPFDPYFKMYKNESFSFLYKKLCETKISCLTENPQNMLMWSHYADNHKGICLEYEIDKEKVEKNKEVSLKEVRYEGLKVNSEITLSNSEMIFINGEGRKEQNKKKIVEDINIPEIFIRKNGEWKYEKEYRLMYFDKNDKEEYFKDIKLKSVTFGLHTIENDKDFIKKLLKDEKIEYYQIEEGEDLQLERKKIE